MYPNQATILYLSNCILQLLLSVTTEAVRIDPSSLSDLLAVKPQPPHHDVTIQMNRSLVGAGLHRTLVTEKIVHDGTPSLNPIVIVEHITQDLYVDVDQISSLEEFGGPQMIVSAHMDTEKPATASKDHTVVVYIDNRSKVELPIHFRYQAPSSHSKYHTVTIPPPLVLYRLHSQDDHTAVKLPCNSSSLQLCSWTFAKVSTDSTVQLEASIPCGLQQDTYLIVIVTVLVTIGATICLAHSMIHTVTSTTKQKTKEK